MAGNSMKELEISFSETDLKLVFGNVSKSSHWHNISEWVSRFNKTYKRFGVSLDLCKPLKNLVFVAAAPINADKLVKDLFKRKGSKQKVFARLLEKKLSSLSTQHSSFREFQDDQLQYTKRSLEVFSEMFRELIWVTPPYSRARGMVPNGLEEKSHPVSHIIGSLLSPEAKPILIAGETGIGKTALLHQIILSLMEIEKKRGLVPFWPIYVPASRISFAAGGTIRWDAVPGSDLILAEKLEALFKDGRLLLLIDDVSTNAALSDFSKSEVFSFWQQASRNKLVLTFSDRFLSNVKLRQFRAIFGDGFEAIKLLAWKPLHFRALYNEILKGMSGQTEKNVGKIKNLACANDDIIAPPQLIRHTPLTALAQANYVIARNGSPRNEYEILEHAFSALIEHEVKRDNACLDAGMAKGLLMRMAWSAYLKGQYGKEWHVSSEDIMDILKRDYPFLAESKEEIFYFLVQIPLLGYSAEHGVFHLDHHFSEFLVARYILERVLCDSPTRTREIFINPLVFKDVWCYLSLGIEQLAQEKRTMYLDRCQDVFDLIWNEWQKTRSFNLELAIGRLIQPLGHLRYVEVNTFLRQVCANARAKAHYVHMSASIGLAFTGDNNALKNFIEYLKTDASAGSFNRTFNIFRLREDKKRSDIENFNEKEMPDWDNVCDMILRELLIEDFKAVDVLIVFNLYDFLKKKGPGPFMDLPGTNGQRSEAVKNRKNNLTSLILSLEKRAQKENVLKENLEDLKSILSKLKIYSNNGGSQCKTKQTKKEITQKSR
ncbi:NACHT domain-containing protein [Elusimicrobiota bacterium]